MANPKLWSNVQIAMESALATAINITAISKGATCTVTAANTFVIGDYVKIQNVGGMTELNGRVFRVSAPTGTNFVLEGVDSSSFGTYTSGGTAAKITYGTSLGTARGLSSSGGDYNFIDTTTVHDKVASQIPGMASPSTYTFENIWDVSDAALIAMKAASDTKAQKAFKFTFADGQIMVFNGYVGASLLPGGNAQDLVTTSVVITMFGTPTYYAS